MTSPPAIPPDHPLLALGEERAGEHDLQVQAWPGRIGGQVGFVLHLRDAEGQRSIVPAAEGLHAFVPGERRRAFLDIALAGRVAFPDGRVVPVADAELGQVLFRRLCRTLEGAWHAWAYLAYGWKTLRQIQVLGHPYPVTAEGFLLFRNGFRGGWKDYYYSEGWGEGPIKLKGERPPTEEYALRWDLDNARTLVAFLARAPAEGTIKVPEAEGGTGPATGIPTWEVERVARSRALQILPRLRLDPARIEEIQQVVRAYPDPAQVAGPADLATATARAREALPRLGPAP